ncbi:MAG: hypothetical protein ACRCWS_07730 [Propionibacteriaceae bacterium]
MSVAVLFLVYFGRSGTPKQAQRRLNALHGELSTDDPPMGRGAANERYSTIMRKQIGGMMLGSLVALAWAIAAGRFAPYSNFAGVIAAVWIGGLLGKVIGFSGPLSNVARPLSNYVPVMQLGLARITPYLVGIGVLVGAYLTKRSGAVWTAAIGLALIVGMDLLYRMLGQRIARTEPGWNKAWDHAFRAEGVQQLISLRITGAALLAGVVWARVFELTLARPSEATTALWIVAAVIVVLMLFGMAAPLGASDYTDVESLNEPA